MNFNLTPVVKNLLIINLLMFGITVFWMTGLYDPLRLHFWRSDNFQPWQIVTHMFMHSNEGYTHILFNMFGVFMFGPHMERHWGSKRFLQFYMICGLGAALCQMLSYEYIYSLDPYPGFDATMLGASGALMGILLAFGITFPNIKLMIFPIPLPIKAKYLVTLYAIYELFMGVSGANDGIAHYAHLGGMLFGLVLILYWRKEGKNNSGFERWD